MPASGWNASPGGRAARDRSQRTIAAVADLGSPPRRPDDAGGALVQAQLIPEDDRPAARPPAGAPIFRPAHLKALEALSGSGAAYLLLRLPVPGQEPTKDLDLLVSHDSLGSATAVLERAGFRPLTAPIGLPSKVE